MDNTTIQIVFFVGELTFRQYVIIMESCSIVWTALSVLGIVSNIINIKTFTAMGLRDGVTVSLLSLSIFDLSYVVTSLCLGLSVALYVTELKTTTRFQIEPFGVAMFFANIVILISVTNVLTTTFLAVARCMCVAKPLQFKNTFTRLRTVNFIIAFAIFAVVSYTPILANMGMSDKSDTRTNMSRPCFWVSPNREYIKDIVWVVIDIVLPFSTQLIVLVCVVIMANSLRAVSKFRQCSTLNSNPVRFQNKHLTYSHTDAKNRPDNIVPVSDKLAWKDLRVVQQVILISVVYIICNTPKIMISITCAVESEFAIGSRFNYLYLSVNCLRKHFDVFNSTVNTIIYYKYNTKFRKTIFLGFRGTLQRKQ